MTTEQYLALSALAYSNLDSIPDDGMSNKISEILRTKDIKNYRDLNGGNINPEFLALSSMSNWTLVGYQSNTASGFSGMVFQKPDNADGTPGDIVFAFRGSEDTTLHARVMDLIADTAIFQQQPNNELSQQLADAEQFVYSILNNPLHSNASYSFTGHSLGGSLASYMTYKTNTDTMAGVGKAVTFNAPGIGGVIEAKDGIDINLRAYDELVSCRSAYCYS